MSIGILNWLRKSQTPHTSKGETTMSFTVVTTINLMVGQIAGGSRLKTAKFDRANVQPIGQASTATGATLLCSLAGCITLNLTRITRRSSQFSNHSQLLTTWNRSFQSSAKQSSRSLKTQRQDPPNLNLGIMPLNLRFLPQLALTS